MVFLREDGCVSVERPVMAATGTLVTEPLAVLNTLSRAAVSCTCFECLKYYTQYRLPNPNCTCDFVHVYLNTFDIILGLTHHLCGHGTFLLSITVIITDFLHSY